MQEQESTLPRTYGQRHLTLQRSFWKPQLTMECSAMQIVTPNLLTSMGGGNLKLPSFFPLKGMKVIISHSLSNL